MASNNNKSKTVVIREVWAWNLASEFQLIANLIDHYPFISMDTEFPGVIYRPAVRHNNNNNKSKELYRLLKSNVDALNLIQVGLTLSDASGNLPHLGTAHTSYIWEFNFSDFDVHRHPHAPDSIHLLAHQGIDFDKNIKHGVDSYSFAQLMMSSGLLCNHSVTWITFHSAYDFGYLIKILTRRHLPSALPDFLKIATLFFGNRLYDIKYLIKFCDTLYGGLDRVANTLHLHRAVGKCHQAGSDSLLTCQVFHKIVELYFLNILPENHADVIFGLQL